MIAGAVQDQQTLGTTGPGLEHPAIGTAGLAAPRLPLAAFSSVNSLSEAASLLGPCQGLPGTAAHYSSAPTAGHSQNAGFSEYVPHSSRSAPQISPSVASACAAARMGGIMFSVDLAAAMPPASARSTATPSRSALRRASSAAWSRSTWWLTRRISTGCPTVSG